MVALSNPPQPHSAHPCIWKNSLCSSPFILGMRSGTEGKLRQRVPAQTLSPHSSRFPPVWDKGNIRAVPFRAHPMRRARATMRTQMGYASSSFQPGVISVWAHAQPSCGIRDGRPFHQSRLSRVGGSCWHPLLRSHAGHGAILNAGVVGLGRQ